jgi:hypothetical protein
MESVDEGVKFVRLTGWCPQVVQVQIMNNDFYICLHSPCSAGYNTSLNYHYIFTHLFSQTHILFVKVDPFGKSLKMQECCSQFKVPCFEV